MHIPLYVVWHPAPVLPDSFQPIVSFLLGPMQPGCWNKLNALVVQYIQLFSMLDGLISTLAAATNQNVKSSKCTACVVVAHRQYSLHHPFRSYIAHTSVQLAWATRAKRCMRAPSAGTD